MTNRPLYAAAALQGMLAHPQRYIPRGDKVYVDWHDAIAEEAFQLANAMVEEETAAAARATKSEVEQPWSQTYNRLLPNPSRVPYIEASLSGEVRQLDNAMIWADTPQGHQYWSDRCYGNAPLSERDKVWLRWYLEANRETTPKPKPTHPPVVLNEGTEIPAAAPIEGSWPQTYSSDLVNNAIVTLEDLKRLLDGDLECLDGAFLWSASPMGHQYWVDLPRNRPLSVRDLQWLRWLRDAAISARAPEAPSAAAPDEFSPHPTPIEEKPWPETYDGSLTHRNPDLLAGWLDGTNFDYSAFYMAGTPQGFDYWSGVVAKKVLNDRDRAYLTWLKSQFEANYKP